MKKVISAALSLLLCLTLTLPVYADIWVPPEEEAEILGSDLFILTQPLLWAIILLAPAVAGLIVFLVIRSKRKK